VNSHGVELDPGNGAVNRFRDRIDFLLQLLVILHQVLSTERLVGEAHVHDAGRMALGRRQVHESSLAEQTDPMAGLEGELLDARSDEALLAAQFFQGGNVQLDVEVA